VYVLLSGITVEDPVKDESLIFVPFRAWREKTALDESLCLVRLSGVEAENPVVNNPHDVSEASLHCYGFDGCIE